MFKGESIYQSSDSTRRFRGGSVREYIMYRVDHLQAQHIETMLKLSKDQEKSARKLQFQLNQIDEAFSALNEALLTSISNATPAHVKTPRIGGFFSQIKGLFL